ncbi:uncharacterized protein L201_001312 [Kwoniella dendrophila CBS 6074]|uniref:Uncharacterized protein n=1 Tax=Kwoniella dendrophila CBS 6074 TaxID=1295534 RepID=A0AAX4JPF5_9TREE
MPIALKNDRNTTIMDKEIKADISPPLPLPIHFDLLPSILPGRTLCPVFYVLIDTIPIYLTLDPSNRPHLSLLPLFLTLNLTSSPLSILSTLHLKPNSPILDPGTEKDYSLTLNGIAPFKDIWVPINLAKKICENLNVNRLFWDDNDLSKGLLSVLMNEIQSWDDGLAIGHNWLPPSAQLPKSAYSLSTLLATPLAGLDVIQDNRYITTPLDEDTRSHIRRSAQAGNPSRIREGKWAEAWDGILTSSDLAWKEFLLYPSIPPTIDKPSHVPLSHPKDSDIFHAILPVLSTLINPQSALPSYPFTLTDLQVLFDLSPLPSIPQGGLTSIVSSFLITNKDKKNIQKLEEKEYKARLGICLNDFVGGILFSSFSSQFLDHLDLDLEHDRGRRHSRTSSNRSDEKGVYVFVEKPDNLDYSINTHHHHHHRSSSKSKKKHQAKDEKESPDKSKNKPHNTPKPQSQEQKLPHHNWLKTIEKVRNFSPDSANERPSKNTKPVSRPSSKAEKARPRDPVGPPSTAVSKEGIKISEYGHENEQEEEYKKPEMKAKARDEEKGGQEERTSDSASSSRINRKQDRHRTDGNGLSPDRVHHAHSESPFESSESESESESTITSPPNQSKTKAPPQYGVVQTIDQFPLGNWTLGKSKHYSTFLSEHKDGWQPYRLLFFAILLGYLLGYCQIF